MAQLGRSQPIKPHLARPVIPLAAPVVATTTKTTAVPRWQFERRGAPRPHIVGPTLGPGGPVIAGETVRLVGAVRRPMRDWEAQRFRPHLAPPVRFAPGTPVASASIIGQAGPASRTPRRSTPKPHLFVQSYTSPTGGVPLPTNLRSGLFPLLQSQIQVPRPHFSQALIAFTTPVIAGQTVVVQSKQRPLVGRTVPKPHLVAPILSGASVIAGQTVRLVTVNMRTLVLRFPPHPHLASVNLTPPPAVNPFPPAIVISQTKRRPHVGRNTPKPHLPPGTLAPNPFPPAVLKLQSLTRMQIGRRTPAPHVSGPVVIPFVQGPNPNAPAIIISQALKRALVGRKGVQHVVARPIVKAQPISVIAFQAELVANGWQMELTQSDWQTQAAPSRWNAQLSPNGWIVT